MNNEQREDMDELKQSEATLRVLESGQCETDEDSMTHELGRLLKQSAAHDLPESNVELREMLLQELESDSDPMVPVKTPASDYFDQGGRKRMWMGLAVGAMIAVGGWYLYAAKFGVDLRGGLDMAGDLELSRESMERFEKSKNLSDFAKTERSETHDVDGLATDEWSEAIVQGDSSGKGLAEKAEKGEREANVDLGDVVASESKLVPEALATRNLPVSQRPKTSFAIESAPEPTPAENKPAMEKMLERMQSGSQPVRARTELYSLQLGQQQQGLQQGGQQGQPRSQPGQERYGKLAQQGGQQGQQGDQQQGQQGGGLQGQQQGESLQGESLRAGYGLQSGNDGLAMEATDSKSMIAGMEQRSGGGGFGGGGLGGGGGGRGSARLRVASRTDRYASDGTFGVHGKASDPRGNYFESKNRSFYRREDRGRSGEQYVPIHENQFVEAVGGAAVSTFSIDVDTASYANMRRFLNSGQMPPRDSIRIEELVNYFDYNYPQPEGVDPFSVNMELATCPWNETHKLLRVGLKGKEVHAKERPPTNVVYLIDVSGSMNSSDKLPLLKRGFQMMTRELGENDRVTIVTYAGNAGVALEPTTGEKTGKISEAIERLTPGGSTHGSAGIELAYKLAQQNFISGGVNKVILATDGDLNVGVTDDSSLVKLIKQKASEGVFLTVLGFGTGNLKDGKLEQLADNGNGHYAYIDSNPGGSPGFGSANVRLFGDDCQGRKDSDRVQSC